MGNKKGGTVPRGRFHDKAKCGKGGEVKNAGQLQKHKNGDMQFRNANFPRWKVCVASGGKILVNRQLTNTVDLQKMKKVVLSSLTETDDVASVSPCSVDRPFLFCIASIGFFRFDYRHEKKK